MKFYDKITNGFYEEDDGTRVEITDEHHAELLYALRNSDSLGSDDNGYPVVIPHAPSTIEQIANSAYTAIDNHISEKIKTKDYDQLAEVNLAATKGEYQIEALAIQDWILKVWTIQDSIKSGAVSFNTIDDAIAALPVFEVSK